MRRQLTQWFTDIKRAKTPRHAKIKAALQQIQRVEVPAIKAVYQPLYDAMRARRMLSEAAQRVLLYQPMFRAQCQHAGKNIYLYQGMPYIAGDLRLNVGDHCKISAQTSLVAGHRFDAPTLTLGHHTNIGPGVVISVSQSVTLGNYVRVATGVMICDNPGHPKDAIARRSQPVDPQDVRPVVIEDDVWIGTNAMIMPGVHIGQGAIIAAGSIVTRDIPAYCVAAGSPAKVIHHLKSAQTPQPTSCDRSPDATSRARR